MADKVVNSKFGFLSKFGASGQKSALKPPQVICPKRLSAM